MTLHVNIEKLIKGEVVETGRFEYKSGWNPQSVVHTMCAVANDINNLGGGYIVISVDEKDSIPQLPPTGLKKNELDDIQKKLVELSNLIQPVYFGISDITVIQEKYVFVLDCPGGDHRPYDAPISLSKKNIGRATGLPKIYDAMKRNGSPEPKFETDDERNYFLAVLPVHPEMKERGQVGGEVRGEAVKKGLSDT